MYVDVDTSKVGIVPVATCRPFKSSRVRGPTVPGYGARLFIRWNEITASRVIGPKYPVIVGNVK